MFTSNKPYTNTHIQFNKWDFELSDFQKWSIQHYLEDSNVLITAATGSGKTLPAEFAMEHCVKELKKKVIYTTPIIALTNEKFYTFKNKYPNISFGIMTGPNKFNPDADVLIMTTEILNNTLFKKKMQKANGENSEKIILDFDMDIENELGLVIYDEIHYINDKDRGKVWEESIIQIPKNVRIMGLSATISNPEKLSQLMYSSNNKNTFLCPHKKRVVPLEHYSFITIKDSIIKNLPKKEKNIIEQVINKPLLLQNANNDFDDTVYNKVTKTIEYLSKNNIYVNKYFTMNKIVEMCKENDMLPALCFIFSKKQCEDYAPKITIPLLDENSIIPNTIEKKCIKILSKFQNYKEYIVLPDFVFLLNLLKKGIGIHHAGMIPPFREMVELLYSQKYIKLLFATGTFEVGINMPIRTVVYTSLQKFDGNSFRFLHPHEYLQGAGRAGRRGIDEKGYVIHANNLFHNNSYPSLYEYKNIMNGKPAQLNSKMNINFIIVLKIISSGKNINDFIENSMMIQEISNEKNQLEVIKNENIEKIDKLYNSISLGNIDIETLQKFHELETGIQYAKKKKKKEMERQMSFIQDNKFFKNEFSKYKEYLNLKEYTKKITNNIDATTNYICNMYNKYTNILLDNDFIKKNETNFELTIKGDIATNIHEIHCLIMSDIIYSKDLDDLSVQELVSILSIFTDIRLSDENKIQYINDVSIPSNSQKIIIKIKKMFDKYYDTMTDNNLGLNQNYNIHYDMCQYMFDWCNTNSEADCNNIFKDAKQWGITVGDFIKAIKKINNICDELQKACIICENLKLLQKLKKISSYTQKSIATNQSLYI